MVSAVSRGSGVGPVSSQGMEKGKVVTIRVTTTCNRYAAVVPPVVPRKGRTTVSGVVIGVSGSQAISLRIRGFTSEGISREGLQMQ